MFSVPVQTGPGAHKPPVQRVPWLFPGDEAAGAWLTTHTHLAPRLSMSRSVLVLRFYASMGCYRVTFIFTFFVLL
jgi:hypothetical protein